MFAQIQGLRGASGSLVHDTMVDHSRSLPEQAALRRAAGITIFDSQGQGIKFGSLLKKQPAVVVFIRM